VTTIPSWRPTRRRLTDALRAALAPLAACLLALGGLVAWTVTGNAGSPARIVVADGHAYLPFGDDPGRVTAAFFRITNSGGAEDRLLRVTSPAARGDATFSRHRMTPAGAAYDQLVDSVEVAAGDRLTMTPDGVVVRVLPKAGWREGDLVPFTLHFEHSGRIETRAVVVRPSTTSG
jgi:copper(I)-binding protein